MVARLAGPILWGESSLEPLVAGLCGRHLKIVFRNREVNGP